MSAEGTDEILRDLAVPATRKHGAEALARFIGAARALLFVPDPETGTLLPAPGFPQTVSGGPSWRAFLAQLTEYAERRGAASIESGVELPRGEMHDASARRTASGAVFVVFGSGVRADALARVWPVVEVVGALARAEMIAEVSRGEAAAAREASREAARLLNALDHARADLADALRRAERLNDELAEAHRRKDDFLALLGHELRNPLAAISGALGVLASTSPQSDSEKRARGILDRQTAQLTRLVGDLLDVARVMRGKIELRSEDVRLGDVVRTAIEASSNIVASKGHHIECEIDHDVWMKGDAARLEQVVANLIGNAARYTSPAGRIDVRVYVDGGDAAVAVKDSGIGIAPDMLNAVFEPFVQIAPTIDRAAGGLGIGLTIVRRIVELHGGRVDVVSAEGHGTTFTLRFPRATNVTPPADHLALPRAPGKRARKLVLVVDDNVDAAEMLAEMLERFGYDPRIAHNGASAIASALAEPPHLVLLDIGLPDIDGYAVARKLRTMDALRGTKLVALTGYGRPQDRCAAKEAGFDEHLLKPARLEDIVKLLQDESPSSSDDIAGS